MEVYPGNFTLQLVEANIVKPLKARSRYGPHPVIGNEEVLLPTHENVLTLRNIVDGNRTPSCVLLVLLKRFEL